MFGGLTGNDYLCSQLNKRDMATTRQNFWLAIMLSLLPPMARGASADTIPSDCPIVKMEVEILPDLNIPRAGHQLFLTNGEYVVAGGHTDGFVPTQSAEYFRDGEWHQMQMVYNHDFGFSVVLKSGKVLLGGGCSEPIGIGQTFLAEMYDPQTHTFNGFGSMDQKRAGASGLELDNGCVTVAGNWYHKDGIELFDGKKRFTYIKDVTEERSGPFIFRTDKDNAIIFSGYDTKGDSLHSCTADFLRGEPINIPLFEKWHPFCSTIHRSAESFIGDASKDVYAYLIPVADSTGQVAIARIENGNVSLLPTVCPVPMNARWGGIEYFTAIIADQERGIAYLMGANADLHAQPEKGFRHYVLRIDYAEAMKGKSAPLTLYYTDPMQDVPDYTPILTPEGYLLMAGGLTTAASNFTPSRHVYVLHVGDSNANLSESAGNNHVMWWLAVLVAATGVAIVILTQKHHRRKGIRQAEVLTATTAIGHAKASTDLMHRINELMEKEKLYLNSELKLADLATMLATNRNAISSCINTQCNCSFSQFINSYRINHAKELMRQQPDIKISVVWVASGFSTESSFFRTFKAITGMTPNEYRGKND